MWKPRYNEEPAAAAEEVAERVEEIRPVYEEGFLSRGEFRALVRRLKAHARRTRTGRSD